MHAQSHYVVCRLIQTSLILVSSGLAMQPDSRSSPVYAVDSWSSLPIACPRPAVLTLLMVNSTLSAHLASSLPTLLHLFSWRYFVSLVSFSQRRILMSFLALWQPLSGLSQRRAHLRLPFARISLPIFRPHRLDRHSLPPPLPTRDAMDSKQPMLALAPCLLMTLYCLIYWSDL